MGGVQPYLVCPQCSEEMAFPGGIANMALRGSLVCNVRDMEQAVANPGNLVFDVTSRRL